MSLSRTALRLTTMEALRPSALQATNGPWPTIAGGNVFDSRIDPIDDLAPSQSVPVVCVYTEHDNGDPGQKTGGPPFLRTVDLIIEIAVVSRTAEPDQFDAGVPQSDAQLDASLDLLEAQIRFSLFFHARGTLWRKLTGRNVTDLRSLPHRTSEEFDRLAMRTITMQVRIPDDCYDPAPTADPAGNNRLPEPLKGVIAALGSTSYGKKIGEGLAVDAPVMPTKVPLKKIVFSFDVAKPDGSRDGTADITAEDDNLDL